MTEKEQNFLSCQLGSVNVFRGVLQKEEIRNLLNFLACKSDLYEKLSLYGEFIHSLSGRTFSDILCKYVCEDENAYITAVAQGKEVSPCLEQNLQEELKIFSKLSALSAGDLCHGLDYKGYIPVFENKATDFSSVYADRVENISRYGYGIFASAGMFRVENGEIVPVEAADSVSLDSFVGYEDERQKIIDNTKALVEGRPALNALLCGDAGTGKSSTVKAVANSFFSEGLRLIEVRKDQLFSLSHIMGRIAGNPLKFIIFIDDLSFNKNDDCFSMLKAALEGSTSAKAHNAVIYATSNRRHIVKEKFSERGHEDDVHHSDTVQELLSLSDRFGLTVYFSRPAKALYLDIVHQLIDRYNIECDLGEIDIKAEAFALARGSRSPRAAEQFVKSLV